MGNHLHTTKPAGLVGSCQEAKATDDVLPGHGEVATKPLRWTLGPMRLGFASHGQHSLFEINIRGFAGGARGVSKELGDRRGPMPRFLGVHFDSFHLGIPGIPKMSSFLFLSSLGDPRDPKNVQFLIPFFTWGSQGSQKCPVSYSFLHLGIPGIPKMSSFLFLSSRGDPRDPKIVQFLIPFFTWGSQGSKKCPVSYSFLHLGIPGIPKMSSFLFLSSLGDPRDPKNVQFLIPFFTWGS